MGRGFETMAKIIVANIWFVIMMTMVTAPVLWLVFSLLEISFGIKQFVAVILTLWLIRIWCSVKLVIK